jgi:hypothetical protein
MHKPLRLSILAAALAASALFVIASAGPAAATIDPAQAPTGTHLQSGTIGCSNVGGVVTCNSFELAGVGNTNATVTLDTSYTATVTCTNHGGKLVPVKSSVQGASISDDDLAPKNGRLVVPGLTSGAVPPASEFEENATCPNGNWTKDAVESTIALSGFTYTLQFDGFSGFYITLP